LRIPFRISLIRTVRLEKPTLSEELWSGNEQADGNQERCYAAQ
jgi:hypothetical protein